MNIAIVTPGYLPVPAVMGGAVEALTTFIVNENERADNPLSISLYTIYNNRLAELSYKNTTIYQIKRRFIQRVEYHFLYKIDKKRVFYYDQVVNKLKDNHFDAIIIENNIDLLITIISSGVVRNEKIVYHFHNDIGTLEYSQNKFKILKDNNIPVITVSNYVKSHIYSLIPQLNVYVLPNAIDLDRFRPELYDGKAIREKYGIQDDEIVFMYFGRIVEYKGISEMVRSFKRVVKNGYQNIRLLIVGSFNNHTGIDDGYTKRIKEEAAEVGDRIIFTGFVPYNEIPKYYAATSVVVVVTWMEAAGLVNIEARAMGKALIASNVGGIPEYTNDACMLVNKDISFEDNVVSAFEKVLETPGLMKKMQEDCRIGIEYYSTNNYYKNFRKLIENI